MYPPLEKIIGFELGCLHCWTWRNDILCYIYFDGNSNKTERDIWKYITHILLTCLFIWFVQCVSSAISSLPYCNVNGFYGLFAKDLLWMAIMSTLQCARILSRLFSPTVNHAYINHPSVSFCLRRFLGRRFLNQSLIAKFKKEKSSSFLFSPIKDKKI